MRLQPLLFAGLLISSAELESHHGPSLNAPVLAWKQIINSFTGYSILFYLILTLQGCSGTIDVPHQKKYLSHIGNDVKRAKEQQDTQGVFYRIENKCLDLLEFPLSERYKCCHVNLFLPGNLKKGHRQTVQTKIRCHIMWHLIEVYMVC